MSRPSREAVALVLIAHQRETGWACLCGWSVVGVSHADHVTDQLVAAGLIASDPGGAS